MAETRKAQFRLALRHEGDMWNAYIAQADTMKGAFIIGSIAFGAVVNNEERKQAFMNMMKGILEDAAFAANIPVGHWNEPQDAPESERGGHG